MLDSDIVRVVRKACITEIQFRQIARGDFITYLLPLRDLPTNPHREWHGRVLSVGVEAVRVEVLDPGYMGETEIVRRTEIVSVERGGQV
jgi:hypothetical protein